MMIEMLGLFVALVPPVVGLVAVRGFGEERAMRASERELALAERVRDRALAADLRRSAHGRIRAALSVRTADRNLHGFLGALVLGFVGWIALWAWLANMASDSPGWVVVVAAVGWFAYLLGLILGLCALPIMLSRRRLAMANADSSPY